MLVLNTLSVIEIASNSRAGLVSCEAVARDCLARIGAREGVVKAWSHLDPEAVLRQARALDCRPARGPLHGVPVGVKDVIETYDMPRRRDKSHLRW